MDNKKRCLAYAFLEFLEDCGKDGTIKEDAMESLEVASQCIAELFDIDTENPDHRRELSIRPASLTDIFDVFLRAQQRRRKVTEAEAAEKGPSQEDIAKAEELKAQGNKKMSSKDYLGAIKLYTEAIKLNPKNAVYYSNRAAAYSQAGEHHNAINDAKKALEIDPSYSKAYSRLGLAYFSLEQYEDALKAYKNGLELDPNNTVMKESLETTRKKLEARSGSSGNASASSSRSASGGANSMPDLSSLLSNPAMRDMAAQMMQNPEMMRMAQQMMGGSGGSGGGMPDLASLMSNPAMMNMAAQIMQNPQAMQALQQLAGGSGGTPDLNSLLNNPELMNMARQFMGGNGGRQ